MEPKLRIEGDALVFAAPVERCLSTLKAATGSVFEKAEPTLRVRLANYIEREGLTIADLRVIGKALISSEAQAGMKFESDFLAAFAALVAPTIRARITRERAARSAAEVATEATGPATDEQLAAFAALRRGSFTPSMDNDDGCESEALGGETAEQKEARRQRNEAFAREARGEAGLRKPGNARKVRRGNNAAT